MLQSNSRKYSLKLWSKGYLCKKFHLSRSDTHPVATSSKWVILGDFARSSLSVLCIQLQLQVGERSGGVTERSGAVSERSRAASPDLTCAEEWSEPGAEPQRAEPERAEPPRRAFTCVLCSVTLLSEAALSAHLRSAHFVPSEPAAAPPSGHMVAPSAHAVPSAPAPLSAYKSALLGRAHNSPSKSLRPEPSRGKENVHVITYNPA